MARLIPAAERLTRARDLIQKARDLPVPADGPQSDFSYVANVKQLMQDARDLVKFIPYSVSATLEIKKEVAAIFKEAEEAEKEILRRPAG